MRISLLSEIPLPDNCKSKFITRTSIQVVEKLVPLFTVQTLWKHTQQVEVGALISVTSLQFVLSDNPSFNILPVQYPQPQERIKNTQFVSVTPNSTIRQQ